MAVFYPSCRLRIQLQLDEGVDTAPLADRLQRPAPGGLPGAASVTDGAMATSQGLQAASAKNLEKRKAIARAGGFLTAEEMAERMSRLNEERAGIQADMEFGFGVGGEFQVRPRAISGSAAELSVELDGVVPLSASIERNGLQTADTASVTIDFTVLPIDPRSIRSAFIEMTIGLVSQDDYRAGVVEKALRPDGSRRSQFERVDGSEVTLHSATRFVGYLDEWALETSEDGDTISFSSRDITAGMHSQELPDGYRIDLTLPIAAGVRALVELFPSTRGMQVKFGSPEAQAAAGDPLIGLGILASDGDGPVPADTVSAARKARRGKLVRRAKAGDKMTVWDHVNDTVIGLGFVPMVRGMTLYIIDPRTFYAGTSEAKKLIYGRNLLKFNVARKLGGPSVVPTMEVRCQDPSIGATRWARWPSVAGAISTGIMGKSDPPLARRPNKVMPLGSTDEQVIVHVVTGVNDAARLQAVARSLFEQFGRQEISGTFTTEEVTSFDGTEGDLLDLWPGDAVEMLIGPLNESSTRDFTDATAGGIPSQLQRLQSQTQARRSAYLQARGISRVNADKLAASQERASQVTVFRVVTSNIEWSSAQGVSVSGDFQNFLVVREAPT